MSFGTVEVTEVTEKLTLEFTQTFFNHPSWVIVIVLDTEFMMLC